MAQQAEWLRELNDTLPRYLQTLHIPDETGRFLPCVKGATELGKQVALGFSGFASRFITPWGCGRAAPLGAGSLDRFLEVVPGG